jgi:hypothetical protein
VTSIFDNGDDVRAVSGHVNQITTRSVRELDGVDGTLWADDIGDVRNTGSGRSTEVKHFASGLNVDVVNTSKDTSGKLGSEGVPHAVFSRGCRRVLAIAWVRAVRNADALLAVDALSGREVLGEQEIFLAATYKDTRMTMGLDNDLAMRVSAQNFSVLLAQGSHSRSASCSTSSAPSTARGPASAITAASSASVAAESSRTTSPSAVPKASTAASTTSTVSESTSATSATSSTVSEAAATSRGES